MSLMESLGGPGAGAAIALENLFPPIPSEVVLPLAGFTASRGELGLVEVLAWTTAGSLVGALVLYALGAFLGRRRLRAVVDRLPLVRLDDLDRAEAWFDRHGGAAVFLGRFVPVVRSLVSVPAGVARMPLARFALLTTVGSGLWNTAFVLAGYGLGANWQHVETWVSMYSRGVVLAAGMLVVAFAVTRIRGRASTAG
ncbi:hypothetical protein GCM10023225_16340 [Kineococcus glutinatus]|uniref:VTT domain-containing protein n=1 Tax=Kineococcus glutinatus TaxID=1070872 RepID=A0ABP9HQ15_9ACTN